MNILLSIVELDAPITPQPTVLTTLASTTVISEINTVSVESGNTTTGIVFEANFTTESHNASEFVTLVSISSFNDSSKSESQTAAVRTNSSFFSSSLSSHS
jgi:hypothetical protein